jgi:peptidoglycan/xylan/chitin deacetylase (PgdA/CDA1 family)
VALTYDDGPQTTFTNHILDLLKSHNAKATFFMTGANINKGQIDIKHADVIKRVDSEGHQVASHTWTHLDLSKVSSLDRKNQMWMNEMALRNVLGKIPTYMRPPYSSCTSASGCQQDMADLGYHITNFNVDTDDYNQNAPEKIQTSKDRFKGLITKDGATAEKGDKWLSIGHDILDQTANNLTEYMLSTLTQLGYKAVTVGDCLGDPKANWYRAADGAGVSVANSTEVTSTCAYPPSFRILIHFTERKPDLLWLLWLLFLRQ